jgi:hypothetical protein
LADNPAIGKRIPMPNFLPPKLAIGKRNNVAKSVAEFLSLSGPVASAPDSNSEQVIQSQLVLNYAYHCVYNPASVVGEFYL